MKTTAETQVVVMNLRLRFGLIGAPGSTPGGGATPAGRKRKPKPAGNPAGPAGPAGPGNNAQPTAGNRRRKRGGGGGGAGGGNAQPLAAGEAGRDDDDGDNIGNA